MDLLTHSPKETHVPWNKGKLISQKAPLKLKDIWAIRIHLKLANRTRDLVLFNLAIDSKLRGCDLVKLRVATYRTEITSLVAPPSCSRKRSSRCNSRSPCKHGTR